MISTAFIVGALSGSVTTFFLLALILRLGVTKNDGRRLADTERVHDLLEERNRISRRQLEIMEKEAAK